MDTPQTRASSGKLSINPTCNDSAFFPLAMHCPGIDIFFSRQLESWVNEGGSCMKPAQPRSLNVLIIEDDAMIAMLYTDVLAELGHQVCGTAGTEDEAVELARQFQPDIVIADLGLREGSGMVAMGRILRERKVPHLFITGSDIHPGKTKDPDNMLRKPFNEEQLVRAIDIAIAKMGPDAAP